MGKPGMHPAARAVEAEWLRPRLRPFGSGVAAVVPDGFPAYIRILHPARGANSDPVRWADVAARSGCTMHRLVQFDAINRLPSSLAGYDPVPGISSPPPGNLAPDLLIALCTLLARYTSTTESCWFCLWEGYGWLHGGGAVWTWTFSGENSVPARPAPSSPSELLQAPQVHLPYRDYLLLNGPLEAATELGWTMAGGGFVPQSPNLFWPQDRAWSVASEIDLVCTLVAGPEGLANDLIADPRFEAWRIFPGDPITADSDEINI